MSLQRSTGLVVPSRPGSEESQGIIAPRRPNQQPLVPGRSHVTLDELGGFIKSVERLPPAPTIMVELLSLFEKSELDIEQVVQIVNHDPSLTADVLKRCNSAFFSGENPVEDMFGAVTRLGFYEVYRTIVALFGSRSLTLPGFIAEVQTQLWRHSVATAVVAGVLARETDQVESIAFTSGLLHDIGKIVLAAAAPEDYAGMLQECGLGGRTLPAVERNRFGFDHSQIGARLLAQWNLPSQLVGAVLYHHRAPAARSAERLAALVQLANLLGHQLIEDSKESSPEEITASMAALQLPPDAVRKVLELSRQDMEKIKSLLDACAA